MYDIVSKRNWYFAFSGAVTLFGLVFIAIGGLRPSIDFTGGTVWEARYAEQPSAEEMAQALAELGHPDATVDELPEGYLRIRTTPIGLLPPSSPSPSPGLSPGLPTPTADATPTGSPAGDATPSPVASPTDAVEPAPSPDPGVVVQEGTAFDELQQALFERFGPGPPRSVTTVGPIIGAELIRGSIILIVIGELFILGYLWLRFGFRYGTAAIVALLHDVIVVVGAFAVLGYFFGVEFDALFVTALLTVVGFSVHDTIVVFDRIRENRLRHAGEPFGVIVNHSILQTLGRSINTSLTVVVTLAALYLLGPATIQTFTLALLIGIVSGTYSSIFNASQVLVEWTEWDAKRKARPARGSRAVRPLSR